MKSIYLYQNKEDALQAFSNLKKLCIEKGLNYNALSHTFSRKKEDIHIEKGVCVQRLVVNK